MRILIVEDEQKMAKLLKKGLEEETHSVMLAHDGVEGFEISQTYPFDVIILDVMLPGMTGFEIVLDSVTHTVSRAGKQIHLTKTEYVLLEFMMRHSGRVLPRNAIIEAIWGFESEIENNTLDAFLRLLRKKVDNGHALKLIHTIRGFGY